MLSHYRVHTSNLWSMASVDVVAESEERALEMAKVLIPTCYNYDSYAQPAKDDWQNGRIWLSYEAGMEPQQYLLTDEQITTVVKELNNIRSFNNKFDWAYDLAVKYNLPVSYARALRG